MTTPPLPPHADAPPRQAGLTPPLAHPLNRSLAELEGIAVERGAYESGRVAWLSRALISPIGHLQPTDLRLLVAHGRGLRWIVPLALDRLEREPFVRADQAPGDLLSAVVQVEPRVWAGLHPEFRRRLGRVLHAAREALPILAEPDRTRLGEELDAARQYHGL